jgi:hypothetical protein
MSWLKAIIAFVKIPFSAVLSYFKPLLQSIMDNKGDLLLTAVSLAVRIAESAAKPGETKRAAVLGALKDVWTGMGLPWVENVTRGAIEAAVASLPAESKGITGEVASILSKYSDNVVIKAVADVVKAKLAQV